MLHNEGENKVHRPFFFPWDFSCCQKWLSPVIQLDIMHDAAVTHSHDIFSVGVIQLLPWLAIFQRVALKAIVAHSFEGSLPSFALLVAQLWCSWDPWAAWQCWHQTVCRCCYPIPSQMPFHLPGPLRTAMQVFAFHPCFSVPDALVLWVLFLPVPIRCLPFPPYEQAGAVHVLAVVTHQALAWAGAVSRSLPLGIPLSLWGWTSGSGHVAV